MAMILPIPLADFWDAIPLAQGSTFEPNEAMNVNQTGGGQVLLSTAGERLWAGQVKFGLAEAIERRQAQAILNAVRQPGHPFFCYDRKRPYPLADPNGTILGASSISVLSAPEADLSSMSLQGLPSGYVLTAGDLVGYSFGSNPVRYYVHEMAQSVVADGAGETPLFQIAPFRSHAVTTGTAVSLIKPVLTAKYSPASFGPGAGRRGDVEAGRTFRFIQTLEY